MSTDAANALAFMRSQLAEISGEIFPDLFTLIVPGTSVPDGFGGTTEGDPTEYKNIPGKVEPLGRSNQVIGGTQITNQDHEITMGATLITRGIKSHYQIVRQAQGDQEFEIYENPVRLFGSMDVLMKVAAALKT